MCGINGILGFKENTIEQIQLMNQSIVHRGPDAEGVWQSEDRRVTFGHRRLSILDLSANGAQPMVSDSKEYVITFNGEIYNYLELKQEFVKKHKDTSFRGTSDTELLLKLVEYCGIEETLSLIKGMFAFAVYEKATGRVYIARDRMGEKPLYYGKAAGHLVFASDIGSIEKLKGFDNSVNASVLASYFKGGYISAPYTIYKDIYKLEPGCYLTALPDSQEWTVTTYWNIREVALKGQANPFEGSFEEASAELEKLIKNSVKNQMISDVPLGAFLSGGIDSTLTVALMQSMSATPVRTFTIGFDNDKYNEAHYAAQSAKHLGTDHTEMYVTKEDILGVIDKLPFAYTEPFADSSQIPTMLVSEMTKRHVTVSLSGDAGDEFYCGYNTYKDVRKGLEILASKLPFMKGSIRHQAGEIIKGIGGSSETLNKLSSVLTVSTPEDWYRNVRESNPLLRGLCIEKQQLGDKVADYPDGFLQGAEANLMLMDMLQYLPDDILVKVDRAGMFYSLESRIPLLDRDVMEFAWRLPLEYKYDGTTTKKILKDILYRYVPQEMMNRPKKGFSVPLADWLRGEELNPWVTDMLQSARSSMGEYINYDVVEKMWKKFLSDGQHERDMWNIIMLAQWFVTRN